MSLTIFYIMIHVLFPVHKRLNSKVIMRSLSDFSQPELERLKNKTIFFGHQSVGYNIIQGIQDIDSRMSLHLNIMETKNCNMVKTPVLAHAAIGQNKNPKSKIEEFKILIENGFWEKADIVLAKLCYVDIILESDVKEIFNYYCEVIDNLKSQFPVINVVHVTVPLCGLPFKIKGIVKQCIKRLIGYSSILRDNIVREQYNELLREKYSGKEPLFDLALYESLGPDGMQHYGFWKGQEFPVLVKSYTDDGGHLNKTGRRYVSEQLLITLLNLAGSK
ncbi:MAG: hypothetical protein JW787_00690 [Sedimentisphaerales bacterium]|nr:hypothetical protein [Sedimentisphaerales bacterium]